MTTESPKTPEVPCRRVCIIFNPAAGKRRRRCLDRVTTHLGRLGAEVIIQETAGKGDAEAFAGSLSPNETDVVVAAGGDGTVNEVINGIAGRRLRFAVLPLGLTNVLAFEIGLPREAEALARVIYQGRVQEVWPGEVNGRRFTMMAGIGFDAHVVDRVDLSLKRWLGKGAYGVSFLDTLFRFPSLSYRLTIDGTPHTASSAIIAKGRHYGGKFITTPEARLADPHFFVCLFNGRKRRDILRYAGALARGQLASLPDVRIIRGRTIAVSGADGEPVQCDGDVVAFLPAAVTIASSPLDLVVGG